MTPGMLLATYFLGSYLVVFTGGRIYLCLNPDFGRSVDSEILVAALIFAPVVPFFAIGIGIGMVIKPIACALLGIQPWKPS